jgi:hypothetical protein
VESKNATNMKMIIHFKIFFWEVIFLYYKK